MKTRDRDQKSAQGLPPPPAPTARDANPWTLSGASTSDARSRPGAQAGAPRDPLSPAARQTRFPVRQVPNPKPRRFPVVPLAIFAIVMLAPIVATLRGLGAGALAEVIGPLIALLFVAFLAVRILRSRRR